jgi:hypothetical protein
MCHCSIVTTSDISVWGRQGQAHTRAIPVLHQADGRNPSPFTTVPLGINMRLPVGPLGLNRRTSSIFAINFLGNGLHPPSLSQPPPIGVCCSHWHSFIGSSRRASPKITPRLSALPFPVGTLVVVLPIFSPISQPAATYHQRPTRLLHIPLNSHALPSRLYTRYYCVVCFVVSSINT